MLNLEDLNLERQEKKILEEDVEDAVCRHARECYGMMAEKFTSPAKRSVPDRLFSMRGGRIFFVEFKAPKKRPTPKQAKDHARRRKMGFLVFVIDDIEEGKRIIDRMAKRWGAA